MAAPAPVLCLPALLAMHCWRWCQGWHPERWPAYDAMHTVDDWALLSELLAHLRDNT